MTTKKIIDLGFCRMERQNWVRWAIDRSVIAIGGRLGDVLRIVRDSPTAGKHVFYRCVVE